MKKMFRKNQIIITALAVMIAAAGYISYSDSKEKFEDEEASADTVADLDSILQDIESLDVDLSEEDILKLEASGEDASGETSNGDSSGGGDADVNSGTPGEAVLTSSSTYMAQARLSREQIRAQNKEALLEIINNELLTEAERESAVASMVEITDLVEKEAATELLLEAKGFTDVVVNLTGETADVVVPKSDLDDASRAQIEDIVKRKTGVSVDKIVITPMEGE